MEYLKVFAIIFAIGLGVFASAFLFWGVLALIKIYVASKILGFILTMVWIIGAISALLAWVWVG